MIASPPLQKNSSIQRDHPLLQEKEITLHLVTIERVSGSP